MMIEKIKELLMNEQLSPEVLGELLKELQVIATLKQQVADKLSDVFKNIDFDCRFLIVYENRELKVEFFSDQERPETETPPETPPPPSPQSHSGKMSVRIIFRNGTEKTFDSGNKAKEYIADLLREKAPNSFSLIKKILKHSNARVTLLQYKNEIQTHLPEIEDIEIS
jgi:DNA-directed RNA polymerase subunit F